MKWFTLEKILHSLMILSFSAAFLYITYLVILNADAPNKTRNIKEYKDYINILNKNGSITICTKSKTEWETVPTGIGRIIVQKKSHCIEELCINNKQEIINYINHKYDTDILRDIEVYNKKIEEYKNAKKMDNI